MIEEPKTLESARAYRYQKWAGNPKGNDYREGDCAYEVYPQGGWLPAQCCRKNGHGPEGLYCKQHAKKVA